MVLTNLIWLVSKMGQLIDLLCQFLEVPADLLQSCDFIDEDTEVQRTHKTRKVVELGLDTKLALLPQIIAHP